MLKNKINADIDANAAVSDDSDDYDDEEDNGAGSGDEFDNSVDITIAINASNLSFVSNKGNDDSFLVPEKDLNQSSHRDDSDNEGGHVALQMVETVKKNSTSIRFISLQIEGKNQ